MQAVFFDLDKTLIAGTAPVAFARSLRRSGVLSRATMARLAFEQFRYLRRSGPEESMRLARLGLELAKGWHQETARTTVKRDVEKVIGPIVYPEAMALIESHRAAGDLLVIVSSSPEDVVEPVADHLGIENVIASRPYIDDKGCYTGELEYFAYGAEKVVAMEAFALSNEVDLVNAYAYSDSITDLPMLGAVGNPIVVNPDTALHTEAVKRNWPVKTFVLSR